MFEVKATDDNGQWSRLVTTLRVERCPAFYETWWVILVYLLLGLSGIGYGVRCYVRRMKRKDEELWADSAELVRMKNYLDQTAPDNEDTAGLDRLLAEKAVRIVEAHLSEPDFDVSKLAAEMNMSNSTLTRKLKAITGDTPLDFIRHIKMKHARCMLADRRRNVAEVAAALGYPIANTLRPVSRRSSA
ncbi:MAG: AraC family transcriptional regulator [Paraprevotella sp.]|nr:AraC family transcriptional regulator [Paraprevotella sp.]